MYPETEVSSTAKVLSPLCMRSKAHWGYDAAFMEKSAASLAVSTHVPGLVPQATSPVGQAQRPVVQVAPVAHGLPQLPQFDSSVAVFTQAPVHSEYPVAQTQAPPEQVRFVPVQGVLQAPQYERSVSRSTHLGFPRQSVAAPEQTHVPDVQVASAAATPVPAHASPQVPQNPPSPVARFTQVPGGPVGGHGSGRAAGHEPQVPPAHGAPTKQGVPHAPQWSGSVAVSAHEPEQQTFPVAHATPQFPQFAGSVSGSTQESPHRAVPIGHVSSFLQPAATTARTAAPRNAGHMNGSIDGIPGEPVIGTRTASAVA